MIVLFCAHCKTPLTVGCHCPPLGCGVCGQVDCEGCTPELKRLAQGVRDYVTALDEIDKTKTPAVAPE